jgi:membrane protein
MFGTLWLLTKRTTQGYGRNNCSQMAAAISYYVLFSIVPLAIFLASIFGFVMRDHDLRDRVINRIVEEAPLDDVDGRDLVADTLRGVANASGALSVVGILTAVWSASVMFGAIRKALNVVWGVDMPRPVVQQKLLDLAMVAGLGLLLTASLAGTGALRTLRELSDEQLGPLSTETGFFWSVLPLLLPGVLTFAVFLLVYRIVPSAHTRFREIWPGALFATVLFELLKNGYAIYVANFDHYDAVYGALGAILLFLTWTYLTASILLLGAEVAVELPRVLAGEYAGAGPGPSARDQAFRWVRGLFLPHRD